MKKERIYYWDNLKCVLIFLVVLGHFLIPILHNGRSIDIVYYFIYMFHMPAFIFVSGYFAKSYIKKGAPDISKLIGYLILYVVYKVLIWAVDYAFMGEAATFNLFTEMSAPWYMLGMFVWLLILPFFAKFKSGVSISVAIMMGLIIGIEGSFNAFLCLSRIIVFLPFFLAGYYFKEDYVGRITTKKSRIMSAIFLLLCILIIALKMDMVKAYESVIYGSAPYSVFINIMSQNKAMILRAAWYLIAFMMVFAVMSLIPKRKLPVSYIGERTLAIYIVHRLIREVFKYYDFYHKIAPGGIAVLLFTVVVSMALTIILSGRRLSNIFRIVFKIDYSRLTINNNLED